MLATSNKNVDAHSTFKSPNIKYNQHFKNKKLKSHMPKHVEEALNKLDDIKEVVKRNEAEDEFSHFVNNIACQLRHLPLEEAVECQAEILGLIRQRRINRLKFNQPFALYVSPTSSVDSVSPSDSEPLCVGLGCCQYH